MKRAMSVAGSFYPASKEEIRRYFEHFETIYNEHATLPKLQPKAVIVPHAGYIYSGFTAHIAYRLFQKSNLKRFVVIGPSHRVGFYGSSLCGFSSYETPFGELEADLELMSELQKSFNLSCISQAHQEHSTETQFPFLAYYLQQSKILEIVYGQEDPKELAKVIKYLLQKEDVGVIISTDLSHFYSLSEAQKLDAICIEAMTKKEPTLIHQGCEACGKIGVEALLLVAKELHLEPTLLDYRTSADANGDSSNVVGYVSVAFAKESE